MSGPFKVDPGQLDSAGQQLKNDSNGLGARAPDVSGTSSTHLAAQQAIQDAQAATQRLKAMIGQTGTDAQSAATAYSGQEQTSAGGLKPGDITGVLGDLAGIGTGAFGVGPQIIGATTGLFGSTAGVIGSLTGAAVSGQKLQNPDQPNSGTWNPNNNNPQDSHPYLQSPTEVPHDFD